jgi:sec-independent protein translocase protein TatA
MFRNPTTDLLVVLVIVLLILGPKRLPALGRSLGQGMREFKDSITGHSKDEEEEEQRPELTSASPAPEATPTATPEAAPAKGAAPERQSAEVGSSEPRP